MKSALFVLIRQAYHPFHTPGRFYFLDGIANKEFSWPSLESAWLDDNTGCIAEGIYAMHREHSEKFGTDLWEFYNVPGRSECKIHWGNYYHNYLGCTGIGKGVADINKDGVQDITQTKEAVKELMDITAHYNMLPIIVIGPHMGWQLPGYIPDFAKAFS